MRRFAAFRFRSNDTEQSLSSFSPGLFQIFPSFHCNNLFFFFHILFLDFPCENLMNEEIKITWGVLKRIYTLLIIIFEQEILI